MMNDSTFVEKYVSLDEDKLYVAPDNDANVVFEESLDMVDGEGRLVDVVTVSVEAAESGTLLVHQHSSVMMRVQSQVLRSLDTCWEMRRLRLSGSSKILRIAAAHDGYELFKSVQGRTNNREKSNIIKSPGTRIILEGANTVLLRILALSRLAGRLRCQAVSHEGEVSECEYAVACSADTVTVRRTLASGEVLTTTLSATGRILLHQWSTTGYSLRSAVLGPSLSLVSQLDREEQPTLADTVDINAYFEKKSDLIQTMNQYLMGHSDVVDMIADFLKELLMEKPDDVVAFADEYFRCFGN